MQNLPSLSVGEGNTDVHVGALRSAAIKPLESLTCVIDAAAHCQPLIIQPVFCPSDHVLPWGEP